MAAHPSMTPFLQSNSVTDFQPSMGAVLLGTIFGAFLSGIVTMQVFLYYRLYPKDRSTFKSTVGVIWSFDLLHTCMTVAASWTYLIDNFGNEPISDYITWTVAVTITMTALITFFVHIFFIYRIHTLSKHNRWITAPIAFLALTRLVLALVSTSKMIELKSYHEFVTRWGFIFTAGLSSTAILDILITAILIWFLKRSRTGFFVGMNAVIDSIVLYTIESGLLTSVTTFVSLICWITMPHNLIFLGLHFALSKLYANAFLSTLNARKSLQGRSRGLPEVINAHDLPITMPVLFPTNLNLDLNLHAGFGRESRDGWYNSPPGLGCNRSSLQCKSTWRRRLSVTARATPTPRRRTSPPSQSEV